jgi:microcystin-dependent protein
MTPYIAQITGFGFNFAPKGWAYCAGQLMSIQQNQALFSILGTTFGGNGIQTFALPDLRGRVPISWGQGPGLSNYTLGEQSGAQAVTVLANQLPLHNHAFSVNTALATSSSPSGNYLAQGGVESGANVSMYATGSSNANMAAGTISNAGGNQPISIIQPYNVINYCVALNGIFPSRN